MSALASELSGYSFVPEPELRFADDGRGKHRGISVENFLA